MAQAALGHMPGSKTVSPPLTYSVLDEDLTVMLPARTRCQSAQHPAASYVHHLRSVIAAGVISPPPGSRRFQGRVC
jgi:hypothetical protein